MDISEASRFHLRHRNNNADGSSSNDNNNHSLNRSPHDHREEEEQVVEFEDIFDLVTHCLTDFIVFTFEGEIREPEIDRFDGFVTLNPLFRVLSLRD